MTVYKRDGFRDCPKGFTSLTMGESGYVCVQESPEYILKRIK